MVRRAGGICDSNAWSACVACLPWSVCKLACACVLACLRRGGLDFVRWLMKACVRLAGEFGVPSAGVLKRVCVHDAVRAVLRACVAGDDADGRT